MPAKQPHIFGELDISRRPELTRTLSPLAEAGTAIIDLSAVTYVDSTALSCFISLKKLINERGRGGVVAIVNANSSVRRAFRICQLDKVFSMYDSASAVESDLRRGAFAPYNARLATT